MKQRRECSYHVTDCDPPTPTTTPGIFPSLSTLTQQAHDVRATVKITH